MQQSETLIVALSGILVLGVGSQWIAGHLKIPSILLLLTSGILAGPVTGFIRPDALFGHLILPVVSLSVAVILFEGSLGLRISHLREIGKPLFLLLTVGVVTTGVMCSLAAHWILNFDWSTSILLGSLLTVTGPTVVGPLLRHIRPMGRVGPLARWEGIVVDPIGAVLAVLVFSAISSIGHDDVPNVAMTATAGFIRTFFVGSAVGAFAAVGLRELLRRHCIDDHIQSPVVLMIVVLTFAASNLVVHESGLVAVTIMGVILANQQSVAIGHIVQFKESLSVLLISSLFIVLTSRLDLNNIREFGWRGPAFVATLILVVRPMSVLLSTIGCQIPFRERVLLAWLAPRGIVAAAVASVFALQLDNGGDFVAATFLVIIGTVLTYGLTAGWVARRLGLSIANPQGVLIVSAHAGARAIAHALTKVGVPVRLVDTSLENSRDARMEGLPTYHASILSEAIHQADLGGLGKLFALTANDEVNLLAAARGAELFGKKECYRLSIEAKGTDRRDPSKEVLAGRVLFSEKATYAELDKAFAAGRIIKATKLTPEFDWEDFNPLHPDALPLFTVDEKGVLTVCTSDDSEPPQAGQTVVALVTPNQVPLDKLPS